MDAKIDFTDWRPGTFVRWHGLKRVFLKYIRKEFSVLDLGGCDGALAEAATKTIGAKVTVADVDREGLQRARARGLNVVEVSTTEVGLPSESFEAVLALDLLEHVEDDAFIIGEIARILKAGGVAIISTPLINRRFLPADRVETLSLHKEWGHLRPGYDRKELLHKLSRAGLHIVNVTTCFNVFSQLAYYLLSRRLGDKATSWMFHGIVSCFEPRMAFRGFDMVIVARKPGLSRV
jgi:SAM-dependent methyltransferase